MRAVANEPAGVDPAARTQDAGALQSVNNAHAQPAPLTLDTVVTKLQGIEGYGAHGITLGRSRCVPAPLQLPSTVVQVYRAHIPLRFGFLPVAAFDATLKVDQSTGRVLDNTARFSTSELRWLGRIGGAVLGCGAAHALAGPTYAVVLSAVIGAKFLGGWLDRALSPCINLVGKVSGCDDQGRLLWTGSARGFAHAPVGLIRDVLVSTGGFTYEGDSFMHRYTRLDGDGREQMIRYDKPFSYGHETIVQLKNFPLSLAARLGIGIRLPL